MADGEPLSLPISEGEVLDGKYRVVRVLGAGGVGAVVECRHVQLGQRVALKFLLPEMLADAECVTRFSREARAAVRLKGEHSARVTDIGKLENGAPYMVMEYLHGSDLAAALEEKGQYDVEEAIGLILQACEGIAEAHAIGIIHRDLKPKNLFMTKRPNGQALVKVLDFGIAKNISSTTADTALTTVSSLIGSPHYASPEQMRGAAEIDVRADIWSLGVCLYELLTGQVPFDAPTLLSLCTQVIDEPPRPITHFRKDLPRGVIGVIDRCLRKDREERYPNLGELAADLEPYGPAGMIGVAHSIQAMLANPPSEDDTAMHVPDAVSALPRLSVPPTSGRSAPSRDDDDDEEPVEPPPREEDPRSHKTNPRSRQVAAQPTAPTPSTTPQPKSSQTLLWLAGTFFVVAALAYALFGRAH